MILFYMEGKFIDLSDLVSVSVKLIYPNFEFMTWTQSFYIPDLLNNKKVLFHLKTRPKPDPDHTLKMSCPQKTHSAYRQNTDIITFIEKSTTLFFIVFQFQI